MRHALNSTDYALRMPSVYKSVKTWFISHFQEATSDRLPDKLQPIELETGCKPSCVCRAESHWGETFDLMRDRQPGL